MSFKYHRKPERYKLFFDKKVEIEGFDIETDIEGNIQILSCSNKYTRSETDFLDFLFMYSKDVNFHFNLRFDFEGILKHYIIKYGLFNILDKKYLKFLKDKFHKGKVTLKEYLTYLIKPNRFIIGKYKIKYIDNKCYVLSKNTKQRRTKYFFDISNFYDGSLKECAKIVNMEKFKEDYNDPKYCIQDSKITKQLGINLIETCKKLFKGKTPTRYYSKAYFSYLYLNIHNLVKYCRYTQSEEELSEFLQYCILSYHGGIFETFKIGECKGNRYDINSAYPHAISKLPSVNIGNLFFDRNMNKDKFSKLPLISQNFSVWKVKTQYNGYMPYKSKKLNLTIYPLTNKKYEIYLTGYEIQHLLKHDHKITFIDGYYLTFKKVNFFLAKHIIKLYKLKSKSKGFLRELYKIILNGIYGKFAQYKHGISYVYNPLFASFITAFTRVEIQNLSKYFKTIHSIATDSIYGTPNKSIILSNKLGGLKDEGYFHLNLYQNGLAKDLDSNKFVKLKGIFLNKDTEEKGDNFKVTEENGKIIISGKRPLHFKECVIQKRLNDICKFILLDKEIKYPNNKRIYVNASPYMIGIPHNDKDIKIWLD